MQYRLIEEDKEFYKLREEWNCLLEHSGQGNPFLTWEWMYTWWLSYQEERAHKRLSIIVAEEGTEIYAILPGFIKKERIGAFQLQTFHLMGTEFVTTNYLEIICRKPSDTEIIFSLMDFLLSQKPEIDVVTISHILDDHPQLDALTRIANKLKLELYLDHYHTCLYIPIRDTWDNYFQGLSKNTRYNWRRYLRGLQNQFQAEFERVNNHEQIDQAIDTLFDLHSKRFRAKKSDTFFKSDVKKNFHKKVAHKFFQQDILNMFQLKVDHKPIAIYYCFQHSDQMHFFQSGMDPRWDKYSPGFVLLGMIIRYSFEKGLKEFDFGRGTDSYKLKWNPVSREMMAMSLGISRKGKIALNSLKSFDQIKNRIKIYIPKKGWNRMREFLH